MIGVESEEGGKLFGMKDGGLVSIVKDSGKVVLSGCFARMEDCSSGGSLFMKLLIAVVLVLVESSLLEATDLVIFGASVRVGNSY